MIRFCLSWAWLPLALVCATGANAPTNGGEWTAYGGGNANLKYSPLAEIRVVAVGGSNLPAELVALALP